MKKANVTMIPAAAGRFDADQAAGDRQSPIRSTDGPDVEAIVAFGATLPVARLAGEAERWLDKPVLQINATTYWHALKTNGVALVAGEVLILALGARHSSDASSHAHMDRALPARSRS